MEGILLQGADDTGDTVVIARAAHLPAFSRGRRGTPPRHHRALHALAPGGCTTPPATRSGGPPWRGRSPRGAGAEYFEVDGESGSCGSRRSRGRQRPDGGGAVVHVVGTADGDPALTGARGTAARECWRSTGVPDPLILPGAGWAWRPGWCPPPGWRSLGPGWSSLSRPRWCRLAVTARGRGSVSGDDRQPATGEVRAGAGPRPAARGTGTSSELSNRHHDPDDLPRPKGLGRLEDHGPGRGARSSFCDPAWCGHGMSSRRRGG